MGAACRTCAVRGPSSTRCRRAGMGKDTRITIKMTRISSALSPPKKAPAIESTRLTVVDLVAARQREAVKAKRALMMTTISKKPEYAGNLLTDRDHAVKNCAGLTKVGKRRHKGDNHAGQAKELADQAPPIAEKDEQRQEHENCYVEPAHVGLFRLP